MDRWADDFGMPCDKVRRYVNNLVYMDKHLNLGSTEEWMQARYIVAKLMGMQDEDIIVDG